MLEIEECDAHSVIITPELRLRFRRLGDRWTHAIDIRPGPWLTLAEAVEWTTAAEDSTRVVSPTYQELRLQRDGATVLALLVGRAGPHYFSASLRVSHAVRDSERSRSFGLEYSKSRIEFDVADRCRAEIESLECNYFVHEPPVVLHLGDSRDLDAPGGCSREWRASLVWETCTEDNYDVAFRGSGPPNPPSCVAISDRLLSPSGGYRVRVAPVVLAKGGTNRILYTWSHTRVMKTAQWVDRSLDGPRDSE